MRYIFILLTLCLINILRPHVASAQAQPKGITVSPQLIQLDFAEDKPDYTIVYTNNTSNTLVLTFRAQDISELEEGWKVNFLQPKDALNYRYSLSSWIHFNKRSLTLGPKEKGELQVTIDKDELSPGGHYASILAEIDQENPSDQVTLHGILSSLLFVRTHTGKEIEEAALADFKPFQEWFGLPYQFIFRFNNSGNVELIPYGTISIYNSFSKLIYKNAVNEESLITLPESVRRYDIHIPHVNDLLLPGIYHATLQLHFGKSHKELSQSITFFSLGNVPYTYVVPILLLIIALLIVLKKKASSLGIL